MGGWTSDSKPRQRRKYNSDHPSDAFHPVTGRPARLWFLMCKREAWETAGMLDLEIPPPTTFLLYQGQSWPGTWSTASLLLSPVPLNETCTL